MPITSTDNGWTFLLFYYDEMRALAKAFLTAIKIDFTRKKTFFLRRSARTKETRRVTSRRNRHLNPAHEFETPCNFVDIPQ